MPAPSLLHFRRHWRRYLSGAVGLVGLLAWLTRPSGWWRVELLIRAELKKENGWSIYGERSLLGLLDEGRRNLFAPNFFASLDGLDSDDVRPVSVEQFRCTSIIDVAFETTRPELGQIIATNASHRFLEAMRSKYPDVEFEFMQKRVAQKPSPLEGLMRALSP